MYRHHEESIQNLIHYFSDRDEIIAVVLGGSVAKGTCRPDSDIDGMIIVTEDYYNRCRDDNLLAETVHGYCTYEAGYFDLKYYTKEVISIAARVGSEPARNAFRGAKVLFTKDPEIPDIVADIPVFQTDEMQEKLLAFCGSLALNQYYFWGLREESKYLKYHTAVEIVYCCCRIILQENKVLFPCNRNLEKAVRDTPDHPENIIGLANDFLDRLDDESLNALTTATKAWMKFEIPEDFSVLQTKYVEYYELWWFEHKPFINEW